MSKTVRKFFLVFDIDTEEKWLNEMAAQGFALTRARVGRYDFEECKPNEYVIRTQWLKKHCADPESQKYIEFLRNTGVEIVTAKGEMIYTRKRNDPDFQLLSDKSSLISYYTRLLKQSMLYIAFFSILTFQNTIGGLTVIDDSLILGITVFVLDAVIFTFLTFVLIKYIKIRKKLKKLKAEQQISE